MATTEAHLWNGTAAVQPTFALEQRAADMLRVRSAGKAYLGRPALAEPGWKLMLCLFALGETPRKPHIRSIAARADIPHTTAHRWLDELERRGLVILSTHREDKRATSVQLAPAGRKAMEETFIAARFTK